jgi:CRISPR-associated protein Csm2
VATTQNFQGRSAGGQGGYGGGRREPPRGGESVTVSLSDITFGDPLPPKLFSDIAERVAQEVSPGGERAQKNKPSQLRRFYDEFLLLQQRVGRDEQRFKQTEPFIQMLKAKVAYAKGREKVDVNFEAVLKHVIDNCGDAASLLNGKYFLEAFMAFYKVHGPKD